MTMAQINNPLTSQDAFSYVYITLFMLSYRTVEPEFYNSTIDEKLRHLNGSLARESISKKTISTLRKQLVEAINDYFLPELELTPKDTIDLIQVFTSLTAQLELSLPEQFLEKIRSSIPPAIADSISHLDDYTQKYFKDLLRRDMKFFAQDIVLLFILVIEFIQGNFMPDQEDVFSIIKEKLLSQYLSGKFGNRNLNLNVIGPLAIPQPLQGILASKEEFVLITSPFEIKAFGEKAETLAPKFEKSLRDLFGFNKPSKEFSNYILLFFNKFITDQEFRKQILKILPSTKERSNNIDPSQ